MGNWNELCHKKKTHPHTHKEVSISYDHVNFCMKLCELDRKFWSSSKTYENQFCMNVLHFVPPYQIHPNDVGMLPIHFYFIWSCEISDFSLKILMIQILQFWFRVLDLKRRFYMFSKILLST